MKVSIEGDEMYPVYSVRPSTGGGIECEVPDETVARWNRVGAEWDLVQEEMETVRRDAYNAQRKVAL